MIYSKNSLAIKKWCGPIQNGQKEKSYKIKGGVQEMAVMVQADGKNFNNKNAGHFVLPHPRNQHKIHLNCCY